VSTFVLLPGLAADAAMWSHQLEALHTWRPHVADVHMREPGIESMAAALLSAYPGELVLCGASMGGMVAMEAAHQAPERVRGLALLGTSTRPESDDMRRLREAAMVLFEQDRLREVLEPNVAFAFHPANAADPRLVNSYLDLILRAGSGQLIRQNRAVIARPDARRHLPALRCPTLVMCGVADQLTPPECSQEIAALVPEARLVMLEDCGHMLTMEQPARVSEELAGWLAELPPMAGLANAAAS
jgi:pimeloyl-ACP methyl ester carboxylesterase